MKNYKKTKHPDFWKQYEWGNDEFAKKEDIITRDNLIDEYDINTEYILQKQDLDSIPNYLGRYFEFFKTKENKNLFLIKTTKELSDLKKINLLQDKKNYFLMMV